MVFSRIEFSRLVPIIFCAFLESDCREKTSRISERKLVRNDTRPRYSQQNDSPLRSYTLEGSGPSRFLGESIDYKY